jgi:hypothetical protein
MSDELGNEAVKQALEPVGDLIKRIAGPVADEIGEYLSAVVRPYTVVRKVEAVLKTHRMLKERGISPHAVPPRLLLPILEGASIEDDEELHTRWAALLANAAASPNLVHPSYIEILRQLAPEDAGLLDKLYDHCKAKQTNRVEPWIGSVTMAERNERISAGDNPEVPFDNLVRLGLIEVVYEFDERKIKVKVPRYDMTRHPGVEADVVGDLGDYYLFTDVAVAFVQACRAPKTIDAQQSA